MNAHRKNVIIEKLKLTPLSEEGGFFLETYRSSMKTHSDKDESRSVLTIIYYLISEDSGGMNYANSNKSDITHFFHEGWPVQYITVSPKGEYEEFVLGKDVSNGEVLQLTVKGGFLKAARLMTEKKDNEIFPGETPFALISESTAPGFEYQDRHVYSMNEINSFFPDLQEKLKYYIAPDKV